MEQGATGSQGRTFKMRIVNIDYYMAPPLMDMDECYSHFLGRSVIEVPVVRLYGSTPAGQKTCLHLHKVLPYIYVPYDQGLPENFDEALAYMRRLAFALEKAMKIATSTGSKRQHVHSCSLVRARKFYGYHSAEAIFIKILLYHPQECSRMSALLLSGGVLNRSFQPYEAHIPYLLQVLIDYNLSGMGHIELSNLRFRHPLPCTSPLANGLDSQEFWLSSNILSQHVFSSSSQGTKRLSTCELEADSTVEDILNRKALVFIPLAKAEGRRMVQSLIPMWEACEQDGQSDRHLHSRKQLKSSFLCSKAETFRQELIRATKKDEDVSEAGFCGDELSNLLQSSQPANLSSPEEFVELPQGPVCQEDDLLCDERILKATQTSDSTVAEEEVLEALRWIMSSQKGVETDDPEAEIEQQRELCKLVEDASAVERTLASISEQECQDILECCEGDFPEKGKIPQYDGADDDGVSSEGHKATANIGVRGSTSRSANRDFKQMWGTLPVTVGGSPDKSSSILPTQEDNLPGSPSHALSNDSQREQDEKCSGSVRDLMRLKRAKCPWKSDSPVKLEEERKHRTASAASRHQIFSLANSTTARGSEYGLLPLESSRKKPKDGTATSSVVDAEVEAKRHQQLDTDHNETAFTFCEKPPSTRQLLTSFKEYGMKQIVYGGAFYGSKDSTLVEGSDFEVVHNAPIAGVPAHFENRGSIHYMLTPSKAPPSLASVQHWLKRQTSATLPPEANIHLARPASPKYDEGNVLLNDVEVVDQTPPPKPPAPETPESDRKKKDFSQISAPSLGSHQDTPVSQAGFRHPANGGSEQQITLMSVEALAETRGGLRPDPRYDAITCIALAIQKDYGPYELRKQTLALLNEKASEGEDRPRSFDAVHGCELIKLSTEAAIIRKFIQLVRDYDSDMLIGWEIQRLSLGFLAERAAHIGMSFLAQLSRTPPAGDSRSVFFSDNSDGGSLVPEITETLIEDEWGRTHGSGIYVGGRTVLNLWRIMRGEVKLGNYTVEAVAEAVLKRKVPRISWRDLTRWFNSGPGVARFRSIEYIVNRSKLNIEIMNQLDLVNRTAELAKVFGIDFFSVFSRGSQYRVESMMLRLAHSQNFVMLSPSKEQVAGQPAMECLPLVMEPESKFYTSPVVVLDFQSLYPSMIIAYNLCFSTCLGKSVLTSPKVLGVSSLSIQPETLLTMIDHLLITPNNVVFVSPQITPGVLPRLLEEILTTRIMVKSEMKKLPLSQKILHRVLNARQFALKLIANVTYGYAAAGFSGRMPCAELADSIVQLGRHTLEQAIDMVNSHPTWDARVVYGDTDSMFVLLEGRSREEAFKIGQEIAAAVTACNPDPVTLKMEKVYHPCVLLTKKRYVGYSYESPAQVVPVFDAKGIETVRRDSCAAVAKTLEKTLRTLFETRDLSKVKQYLQRQWQKILSGRISIKDFIFAKEVRLGTYRSSVLPPAAIVASKAMSLDPRAEPCYGERIQYVVVHGQPGARLTDMVMDPYLLLDGGKGLRLHGTYYINKQIIPALQRVFGLVGVDLTSWFSEMPRVYRPSMSKRPRTRSNSVEKASEDFHSLKGKIDHYYLSQHCAICGELSQGQRQPVCRNCTSKPALVVLVQATRQSKLEREAKHLEVICRHCGGGGTSTEVACISLDCSIFFHRLKARRELDSCLTVSEAMALELF